MTTTFPDRIDDVPVVRASDLVDRYDTWLLDAYGVLVDSTGALPGADRFLAFLAERAKSVVVVSNDASRLPESVSRRFQSHGLDLPPDRIITGGTLLEPLFRRQGWEGAPTAVLGPEDSARYVEKAGGKVISPTSDAAIWVIGDEEGYPFLPTVEDAISSMFHRIDAGHTVDLVVPNPDLIHPQGEGRYAITAGSVASLLVDAVQVRYGSTSDFRVHELGKPHRPIFEAALARAGAERPLMLGDQLGTDILGASNAGLHSGLVTTGLAQLDGDRRFGDVRPDWIVASLG